MKNKIKTLYLLLLIFCLSSSCKRLDGDTVVEGQVVDRHSGEAIPNARLVVFSGKGSSATGAFNSVDLEKQADSKGNFSFRFDSDGSRIYVLRAFKEPGYFTSWDDAIFLKEGRNNKRLKLKMQAPAWVRIKLVNVPPLTAVHFIGVQGFNDNGKGQKSISFYQMDRDTTFVREVYGNRLRSIAWFINKTGTLENYHREAFFPALDTVDFLIEY